MEAAASLSALEEQQASMEQLLQQHRRSLDQHRAAVLRLLEGQAARAASPDAVASLTQRVVEDETTDFSSDEEHVTNEWLVCRLGSLLSTAVRESAVLEERTHVPDIDVQSRLQKVLLDIVYSNVFETCMFFLIVANCFIMAAEVNIMLQHALKGEMVDIEWVRAHSDFEPDWMQFVKVLRFADSIVLCLFVLECLLRLLAERQLFFCGPNRAWNLLDAGVTIISVALSVKDYVSTSLDRIDRLRYVRVLRVLRAAQLIRMFPIFRKFRVMLYSILACLQSVGWAILLLYCCVAVMALYLQDVALYNVQRHNRRSSDETNETQEKWSKIEQQLRDNWGNIFQAQLSLLLSVSGGADWGDLAAPFCAINSFNCVVYSTWVIVVIFGLINITVGVFTGQARQFHKYDRRLLVESALADHRSMSNTLMDLFDRMDTSNKGFLSRTAIEQGLKDIHIKAYFAQLNIDVEMNPDEFFKLLDEDKNDRVDRDEFAKICMRLQGGAKPLELARIIANMEEMKSQLQDVQVIVGSMSRHSLPAV